MKKSLFKNIFREIKNSKARFFSITAIIALGVGFYCGIKMTSPSMVNMADKYYRSTRLMDYRLVSTVGFDDDDVKEMKKIDGVTVAEGSYFADVTADYHTVSKETRVIAVTKELNRLTVTEGRLPETSGEIVVEDGTLSGDMPKIGEKLTIETGDTDVDDILKAGEYKVVGYVRSPLYISYERGNTSIGDGSLDCYMYTTASSFLSERYTELYLRTAYARGKTVNDGYTDNIEAFKAKVEEMGDVRLQVFKEDNIDSAQNELDEKKAELQDKRAEAEKELKKAKKELDDAEDEYYRQINSAQDKINSARSEINSGYDDYYSAKEKYEKGIASGEKKLKASQKEYKEGLKKYQARLKEYQKGLGEYNKSKDEFYSVTKPELEGKLEQAKAGLEQINASLSAVEAGIAQTRDAAALASLTAQREELLAQKAALEGSIDEINQGISKGEAQLSAAGEQLDRSKAELDSSEKQLDSAEAELEKGKAKLEKEKKSGKAQLEKAYAKLIDSEGQLAESQAQLEESKRSGLRELKDGKKEYAEAKAKTEKKLNKAEKKLDEAQTELNDIEDPKLYVYTREDNPGYSGFAGNAGRVDAVAKVFPVFFLLVAALVCLTSMTRLVDERRTEIGTLKALGYSNSAIAGKFIIYSTSAGLLGAVLGAALGMNTLPYIIYNAYRMMYCMDSITVVPDPVIIIFTVLTALLCTTAVTAFTCYKSLKNRPAKLMRPKGPKSGKRILLERFTPLWSRLSFTSKVTARNLFRYKSRMFMTVVGVAGCTALIIAAFGLDNSLSSIARVQFDEIFKYDAVVIPENGDTSQLAEIKEAIDGDKNVVDEALVLYDEGTVQADNRERSEATILVPKTVSELNNVITLRTRRGHKELKLGEDGAVITEKMASTLGVSVGDSITVNTEDRDKSVRITGICEQYVGNYVYMTPSLYENCFGDLEYNTFLVKMNGSDRGKDNFGSAMLERDDVMGVTFMGAAVDEFNDILSSMNMIVFVLIICAGALAFVVLYNLTNINLAERNREIATIKVLGFNSRETDEYIYRENMVLVLLGILLGFVMGTFLCYWVIVTVEVDNVMFGRSIGVMSYVYSAALTALFAVIVNIFMHFKMKKIDMVESLKSVE